jgi:hypothetical protein
MCFRLPYYILRTLRVRWDKESSWRWKGTDHEDGTLKAEESWMVKECKANCFLLLSFQKRRPNYEISMRRQPNYEIGFHRLRELALV